MDVEILGDRYELQEPIGRGGMATIYRAVDLRMGRVVAVKILREVYSNDPKFVTRFQREARSASLLQHPNIVQVFDYGHSGETYYIVMEFIEGTDLRAYLKRQGRLTNERAIVIAHDVALGLGAAHKRGIVHRDVKPQNILLNDEGLVKLTDFGIASVYKEADAERLTTTGMTLGTVQYYAPEQAQGEVVTPSADIYALGIVMYEMLAGRTPFDGDTPVAVAMRHIQDLPDPPSRYNPNIAPMLERIILRCLEKDPRDRYRDGDTLALALENAERQPAGRSVPSPAGRTGAPGPGGLLKDPWALDAPAPGGFGMPGVSSGPRGARMGVSSGPRPMGPNGPPSNPGGMYDVPGYNTRPHGPAAGTVPRSPSQGRTTGPNGLPPRPDEEGRGRRTGPIVATVTVGVLLLLGLSCYLVLGLTGGGNLLGFLNGPSATPTFTAAPTSTPPSPTVTAAPTQFPMPNFVKQPEGNVSSICQQYQLRCIDMGFEQSNIPFDEVTRTNPAATTLVLPGASVQYWLSYGPPTATPTVSPTPTCAATATPGGSLPTPTPAAGCP
jgi:serine/threonine-protein kinase